MKILTNLGATSRRLQFQDMHQSLLRLTALGVAFGAASLTAIGANQAPLEIAAILSLSGPYASVGSMEARAINTSIALANASGGVDGRPLTLHLFDDQSDTGHAYLLAEQIVRANTAVAIIGGSTSPSCQAIHLATGPQHVLQFCLSGNYSNGATYFSSFAPAGDLFGALPAAFFAEHRLKRIAVIAPDTQTGILYDRSLQPALVDHDMQPLSRTFVNSRSAAINATLKALRNRADAIYVGGDAAIEQATLQTIRKRHKRTTVWLVDMPLANQAVHTFNGLLPRGPVYTASSPIMLVNQLPTRAIERAGLLAYQHSFLRTNGLAPNVYAAVAADATNTILAGLHASGGATGLTLAQRIATLPPSVGLYANYHFNEHNHNGVIFRGTVAKLNQNGHLSYVETLQPNTNAPARPQARAVQSLRRLAPGT